MATKDQTQVLLVGATGYVGGTILATLLTSPDEHVQKCKLSAVIRGADRAAYFESKGVRPIQFADLDDVATLKRAASEADVVLNCATGFATGAARALIEGLALRREQTGTTPHFIHLSGTSNLGDLPITKSYIEPRFASQKPFIDTSDDIVSHMRARDAQKAYPQRTTDLAVVDAGRAHAVATHILMPPTVWGKGAGAFHKRSMQVPALCRAALAARQAVVLGDGAGVMDHVHVADLAALFVLVLRAVLAGEAVPSGEAGVFFCETGHHSWLELAQAIGAAGRELGVLDSADVRHLDLKEGADMLAGNVLTPEHIEPGFGLNSITQTARAKMFGWEPQYTRADFFASARDELEVARGDHD